MRIQRIDNTHFGYNVQVNKKLVEKLKQSDPKDATIETIAHMQKYCLETEELLETYYEGTGEEPEMLYALLHPKHVLSDMVDRKFPELNYKDTEIKDYLRTARAISRKGEDEYPWQFEMVDELADGDPRAYDDFSDHDFDNDSESASVAKALAEKFEPHSSIEKIEELSYEEKIGMIADSDVVEKFVPSFSSPKGFSSIAGMQSLKEELYDKVIYPLTHPKEAKDDFAEYGKREPRGIMLYGPPGCGKTYMAEALAMETKLPMFKLKVSKAGSKYINETSENYQAVFDYVANAAKDLGQPCFLFIDEMDGISKGRDGDSSSEDLKQMGTLLNLIETARDRNIIVLGATNKYDIVDPAIKRRFDEQVYIPLPDEDMRAQVFEMTFNKWLKGIKLANDKEAISEIAMRSEGFPTSALIILADKASTRARRDGRRDIAKDDVIAEIEKNQNLKVEDDQFKPKAERRRIGFQYQVVANEHKS